MFMSDKGDIRAKKKPVQGDTQHRAEGWSFRKTHPSCVCPHTQSCQVCETKPTGREGEPDKPTLAVETAPLLVAETGSPSHPELCSLAHRPRARPEPPAPQQRVFPAPTERGLRHATSWLSTNLTRFPRLETTECAH